MRFKQVQRFVQAKKYFGVMGTLTDINLVPLMPDVDETFSGSLVLDLRI